MKNDQQKYLKNQNKKIILKTKNVKICVLKILILLFPLDQSRIDIPHIFGFLTFLILLSTFPEFLLLCLQHLLDLKAMDN